MVKIKSDENQRNQKKLELVGRHEEMSYLEQVSTKWVHGAPSLVVIMAPSGYGKSSVGSASRAEISKLDSVISWYEWDLLF